MASPHDHLFAFTFRHAWHAAGWLRSVLPGGVTAAIDWATLQPLRERFPGVRLRSHLADAAFVAQIVVGETWYDVVLLVEHTSHGDADVEAQLLRYSIHLQRALQRSPGRRPFVVPILLRHGAGNPRSSRLWANDLLAELDAVQPRQRFYVDDLDDLDERALAPRRTTALAELTLLCLRHLRSCPPSDVPAAFDRWQHLLRAVDTAMPPEAPPIGADAVDAIGWYALKVTEVDSLVLSETFCRILQRDDDTIMSTLDRTYQKGKAEGKAEGRAEALLRLLDRRFGPLDEPTAQRIRQAGLEDLDRWTDRVLDAATLPAVLRD